MPSVTSLLENHHPSLSPIPGSPAHNSCNGNVNNNNNNNNSNSNSNRNNNVNHNNSVASSSSPSKPLLFSTYTPNFDNLVSLARNSIQNSSASSNTIGGAPQPSNGNIVVGNVYGSSSSSFQQKWATNNNSTTPITNYPNHQSRYAVIANRLAYRTNSPNFTLNNNANSYDVVNNGSNLSNNGDQVPIIPSNVNLNQLAYNSNNHHLVNISHQQQQQQVYPPSYSQHQANSSGSSAPYNTPAAVQNHLKPLSPPQTVGVQVNSNSNCNCTGNFCNANLKLSISPNNNSNGNSISSGSSNGGSNGTGTSHGGGGGGESIPMFRDAYGNSSKGHLVNNESNSISSCFYSIHKNHCNSNETSSNAGGGVLSKNNGDPGTYSVDIDHLNKPHVEICKVNNKYT